MGYLGNKAANTVQIQDNSVTTSKIADLSVTGAKLENSGVTAGSYGSSSAIPVVTVDAKGRVTSVSTSSFSASPEDGSITDPKLSSLSSGTIWVPVSGTSTFAGGSESNSPIRGQDLRCLRSGTYQFKTRYYGSWDNGGTKTMYVYLYKNGVNVMSGSFNVPQYSGTSGILTFSGTATFARGDIMTAYVTPGTGGATAGVYSLLVGVSTNPATPVFSLASDITL